MTEGPTREDGGSAAPATTWGAGDYPSMATRLTDAAIEVVDRAGLRAGDAVLDVATGTGNAALDAAGRGARVVGIDFEPALIEVAARRSPGPASGRVTWVVGDATAMPFLEGSFDVVMSVFGAMYAPDHEVTARELARVAAPGGRLALAAWSPGSALPTMGALLAAYLPPPPAASGPPSRWGDPDAVQALLDDHEITVTAAERRSLTLRLPDAAAGADFLIRTAGNVMAHQPQLVEQGRWEDLRTDITTFVAQHARATTDGLDLALDYLLVAANKL